MQSVQPNMSMYAGRRRRRPVKRLTTTTGEVKTNPSKRHRDRLNTELDTLASLLPLDEETVSKLDKLSILRLCVSYLRNKSYFKALRNNQTLSGLSDISLPAIPAPPVPHPAAKHSQPDPNQYEFQCKQEGADKDWTDHISTEEGQMLIEALNGFVIVVQQDGQIFYVSSTIREYLGFQEADVMHQCVYELIHKDDRLAFQQQMCVDPINEEPEGTGQELQPATANHDFGDNIIRSFECRFRCLLDESSGFLKLKFSGKLRPLYGQRVRGKDGIPVDKDPPELALFALACPVEQYSIVEIHIRNTIFRTKHDLSFRPLAADKMGVEILGYSEMELIQLPGYHYLHYEDLIYLSDLHSNLLRKGEVGYCYFRLYRKTGKWMWVQVKPRVIYKNDQPDYLVSTHRPMSDQEGEQHQKQRENPFKFPFKNVQSPLYDLNNPYPPLPREIIEYIKSGFKPQFGKEGGPPIDFGGMGPPPKGAGPPGAGKQPLNGGMQPRSGLGSRPPKSVMPASVMRPGVTANRVDTIKSFVGPDGVQNTIMQTQITRCANQIQKLKIPDQFNVEYTRPDMIHAAPMITDLDRSQQMGADLVGITDSAEVVFGHDTIPTFNETIMPLEMQTELPTREPFSCQEDQSYQFSNADVPTTSTTVSCMQGPNQNFGSKDMMMYQTAMETGGMNQKNNLSFPNNSLSDNVNFEQCPMFENSLQHPGESNLLPGSNCVQKTGVATRSKLHDMLTKPTHNVHHHSYLQSGTNNIMKRERSHTVEYLPSGSKLVTPAQQTVPSSLPNIQTNQLTEQGRLTQPAQYRGIPPVVSANNQQVFGTVGENNGVFQQNHRHLNTNSQIMSSGMKGVSAMENQMTMVCGGQDITSVGNQRRTDVGNQYGIAPGCHEINSVGINQMPANNHYVNGMGIMVNENQRNMPELSSGYQHMMNGGNPGMVMNGGNEGMMMTGNQRMINNGTGIVQNHHGMMNVMNQGIADTGSHQGIVNARNQGISNMGNHQEMMISKTQEIPGTANYQGIMNARRDGIMDSGNQLRMINATNQRITNSGSHPGMMNSRNQGIPNTENHHPGLMNVCDQGILGTANQMGMVNAGNQGIPNPRNHGIPNIAYQGMGNIANQSLMYSDNQVMGGTYPARSQQEIMEMLPLSGNNIELKGNNVPTGMARNVMNGQSQRVFLRNEQMTAKDAMMYSMMQKQLQTPNNQGMGGDGYISKGMMYYENDMQANTLNQEMEAKNTRVNSTDSGGTGYVSSELSSVLDDYCSSTGMQLTPNSVFSSPSGKSGSPDSGLQQHTELPGDSCELIY